MRLTSTVDISRVESLLTRLPSALSVTNPAIRSAVDASADLYLQTMDQRFGEMSAGGWEPLAKSTIRQRMRQGYPGPAPILERSRELRTALQRGQAGNVFRQTADGVEAGIGGNELHSHYPGQNPTAPRATIGQIAEWHQAGTLKMRARKILDDPEPEAHERIVGTQLQGVNQAIGELHRG